MKPVLFVEMSNIATKNYFVPWQMMKHQLKQQSLNKAKNNIS